MIKIINFKKIIKQLPEGSTYLVTFPEDCSLEVMEQTVNNINKYVKEKNRNIVFIYTNELLKVEEQKVEEQSDETKRL